ncbi:protein cordon-bleu isoform X8 [Dasypus novemcinctus]|uniref:protein cordon-bleu isoform X8 n=1 Tax=Dasypus novemcinctus TaxID=9361 RepID=UPI00265F07CF|nr:protein cordon-bleu isoform X8 [Dasypus novemcinctus]
MDAPAALAAKPPTGRKMKARAPPPPGQPATPKVHGERKPNRDLAHGPQQNLINMKENLWTSLVDITVVLPSGLEKKSVVNGSHAMMDLLVELCLQNHLNPSLHALEIRSSDTQQPLSFKPNTLVGALNVHTVFLKEKVPEEKASNKPGPPKLPEKSVRLVVNYLRTQKAVVRVSPEVPLRNILPVICAKCEVSPESVLLLRDNITGEELELSKSLNELGIKELYAWDNKRETIRKSSLGNDETDKEKKKFLGFFKVNKRRSSKAEQLGLLGVDNQDDVSESTAGRDLDGCLTTPNSPSVISRSMTLGPSLSLSNISGMSVKSEMKKRRAPPPPSTPSSGTPVQDKASEKVSLGSQMDLQKKKRRAPAPPPPQPPPPSPSVPSRMEDTEDKRRSAAGVGRQVPQKPPRGSARGPPQLVLPPPPPYPPPDADGMEALSFPGEGAAPEASDPRPKPSPALGPGRACPAEGAPLLLSEAEETVSVGSCFTSEDTTEDSGVMSSPSDVVSLDSQHDSVKSRDKWATDQEDCSDQDLPGTPEPGPPPSPAPREPKDPGHGPPRSEKAVASSNDDEDLVIAGQFQKTLAELDDDLEDMEDSYATDASSPCSSVNGVTSCRAQDAPASSHDADAIPVTFIGEVLDDPVDAGFFPNSNNNAGSFNGGSVASRRAHVPPFQDAHSQRLGEKREDVPESHTPSRDVGDDTCQHGNSVELGSHVTSAPKVRTGDRDATEQSQVRVPACRESVQAAERAAARPPRETPSSGENSGPASPPHHPGGSYGLKYGLTTYKIVPPKSETRRYDRGVSLSTGAIKIDELGNLVNPHGRGSRTLPLSSPMPEASSTPIGKAREFWRSGSGEKDPAGPTAGRLASVLPAQPPAPPAEGGSPVPTLTHPPRAPPQPQPAHRDDERQPKEVTSRPPAAGPRRATVPAAGTFLVPQRRTSSQYVASAIAKRFGPAKGHVDPGTRPQPRRSAGPELTGQPPPGKDDASADAHAPRPGDAGRPCSSLPGSTGAELAGGARPMGEVGSPRGKSPPPVHPAGIQAGPRGPRGASLRDGVPAGQSCGFGGKPRTSHPTASSASDPKAEAGSAHPALPRSHGTTVNGAGWPPGTGLPPHSLKVPAAPSRIVPEREDKPPELSASGPETNGPLPPSIFGPKKKFRPVVQRPAPKDTSLHASLMEAIHAAGGKEKLRKVNVQHWLAWRDQTAEHIAEGGPKKPSPTEAESERSALLAAIRGHSGACGLRKVTSSASEELQSFRDAQLSVHGSAVAQQGHLQGPRPPVTPPAPPPPAPQAPPSSRISTGALSHPGDARQALLDAIRSGTGAARLKKLRAITVSNTRGSAGLAFSQNLRPSSSPPSHGALAGMNC